MILTFAVDSVTYFFESSTPHDISIPLDFKGEQPHAFHLPRAESHPFEAGGFVGDTRQGGGCNCETITFNPHGNGTHTECVGHVSDQRHPVASFLPTGLIPATLVTVAVTPAGPETEGAREGDMVIARAELERAVASLGEIPNGPAKLTAEYSGTNPPYVSREAMRFIRELGVDHLLVDLPSVDRESDDGALAAHRIFWEADPLDHDIPGVPGRRTITEMIYAEEAIPDGIYMLDLQIPNFLLDAAPSRPLIHPVVRNRY